MQRREVELPLRDALIFLSLSLAGGLVWAAVEGMAGVPELLGLAVVTAAGAAVAYWRGRRFGEAPRPD